MNSALNCTWKPIWHSSLRDSCDIGFRVQCKADFPRQVMNFATEFSLTKPANKPLSRNVKQDNGCHENTAVVWQTKCANLRFQRHRQREQTTVILSFSTFHSTVLLPVHFNVICRQYWIRAKSNNYEMVTIAEMFIFNYDSFAAVTGTGSRTTTEINWETLKAVRQWNLSLSKIASHILSAFEILSGHCQTGKLTWKK